VVLGLEMLNGLVFLGGRSERAMWGIEGLMTRGLENDAHDGEWMWFVC